MPKRESNKLQAVFLDTAYIQAIINPRDQYHTKAVELSYVVQRAISVWTTEFVLLEVADALCEIAKDEAIMYTDSLYLQQSKFRIIELDRNLYIRGRNFYRAYHDKGWGLTDCISFVVMQENKIFDALTSDQHFVQAGFRALMRDE